MEIHFDKEYLQQLYEEGKTKDKKYRFQPQMVKRYQLRHKDLGIRSKYRRALRHSVVSLRSIERR